MKTKQQKEYQDLDLMRNLLDGAMIDLSSARPNRKEYGLRCATGAAFNI